MIKTSQKLVLEGVPEEIEEPREYLKKKKNRESQEKENVSGQPY